MQRSINLLAQLSPSLCVASKREGAQGGTARSPESGVMVRKRKSSKKEEEEEEDDQGEPESKVRGVQVEGKGLAEAKLPPTFSSVHLQEPPPTPTPR